MSDDEIADRVENSSKVIGHAHNITHANSSMEGADEARSRLPVLEGVHYEVVAYTDWADYFVPTIVMWENGEMDLFADLETSLENRRESRMIVDEMEA